MIGVWLSCLMPMSTFLFEEETAVPKENHRSAASRLQT